MSRNLKSIALAGIAVFMLSILTASAAQATNHHLTVPKAPAIITGEQTGGLVLSLTNGERKLECTNGLYEATERDATNTEVTATATLSGCNIQGLGINVTFDLNHCAFITNGTTDGNGHAAFQIECAAETEITATYSVFGSSCVVHITPQTPQGGVNYSQSGNSIDVEVTASGIKYHETGGGFCPASHTGEDATLTGELRASAYKENESCAALTGTGKTTPGNYFNECEGAEQKLELSAT